MLSVRLELSAAKLREERQANPGKRHALLQLLPPSRPPCNPLLEGLQAAQSAAGAAGGMPAGAAVSSCGGWLPPDAAAVQALRQSMWRRARGDSSAVCNSEPASPAAADEGGGCRAAAPAGRDLDAPLSSSAMQQRPQGGHQHAIQASSSSKAPRQARQAAAPRALGSPTLADVVSLGSRGLALAGLLSEESLDGLPDAAAALDSPPRPEQHRHQPQQVQQQRLQQQLLQQRHHAEQCWLPSSPQQQNMQGVSSPGSPCMAESCASFSVVAENHSTGSEAVAGAQAGKQHSGRSRPLPLAASPMMSAAASFMPPRPLRHDQDQWPGAMQRQPSSSALLPLAPAPAGPPAAFGSPAHGTPHTMRLPAASPPLGLHRVDSRGTDEAGTPGSAAAAADSGRRQRAASVAFTLTPPRRLEDSPLSQPAAGGGHDATPIRQLPRPHGSDGDEAAQPPAVLQPVQPWPLQAGHDSPALLASCFKSKAGGLELGLSPLATPMTEPAPLGSPVAASQRPLQGQLQPPRWALAAAAARSAASGSLDSPRGSGGGSGRRRGALHTTSSPACREAGGVQGGDQRRAPAAASPLVTPPRSLLATPGDGGRATVGLIVEVLVRTAKVLQEIQW